MRYAKLGTSLSLIGAFAFLTTGCATKNYVAKAVSPLRNHIDKVDKDTQQNAQDVKDLDAKTERGISTAQNSADKASQSAEAADQHAQSAQTLAQQGETDAKTAQEMAENVDNYQPNQKVAVLFDFNSDKLTKEGKDQLDQFAQTVQTQKHYVIQVQGYTDRIGSEDYNLDLSRRRADAVVRYLTLTYNVPLVKVSMLGYGKASPAADNKTREGRKENRRVQLTLMVPPSVATAQAAEPQAQSASQQPANPPQE
ncbi:MAG TPA: OmpA family protein [Terriglobia bacterium]|nr:OmpA family protein [Terriglobia bacterium]